MEKIGEGNRGEVFLTHKDGKKIIIKKALDQTKKGAIKKEIQILQKINELNIDFVPQILSSGEDFFEQIYVEGQRFDFVFKDLDAKKKVSLIKNMLQKIYILDKNGIIHGELIRPFSNVIVDKNMNIFIIDFERGNLGDFSGKNLRMFAQRMAKNNFLNIENLKQIGKLKDYDEIYKYIISNMENKNKDYKVYLWILLLIVCDQATKYIFFDKKILEGLFTPVLNNGISRSLSVNMILIYIISLIALGFIYYLFLNKKIGKFEFIFFSGGLLGNLIDRLFLGGVRDFIDLRFFPIFNLADIFLSVSVIWMFYLEVFGKGKKSG